MRYCLAIINNGTYYELNGYSQIPGFEHLDEKSIKDIVTFTNNFDNEINLINFFIETGIINKDDIKGQLGILFYKSKDSKPKVLPYNVSYKEEKKYFDTIFLQYYFSRNMNNPKFLELFLQKYYDYLKSIEIFNRELAIFKTNYDSYAEYGYLPETGEDEMSNFIKIYCRKKGKDGYYKANFAKIRELAMFAINFERTYNRIKEEYCLNNNTKLEELINHYETIINNGNITNEQQEIYIKEIEKLKTELEYTQNLTLNRSK